MQTRLPLVWIVLTVYGRICDLKLAGEAAVFFLWLSSEGSGTQSVSPLDGQVFGLVVPPGVIL